MAEPQGDTMTTSTEDTAAVAAAASGDDTAGILTSRIQS